MTCEAFKICNYFWDYSIQRSKFQVLYQNKQVVYTIVVDEDEEDNNLLNFELKSLLMMMK
ncbi:hypothetical protein CsSME_00023932 [Camellia sinensis var. sinensis]